MGKEYIVLSRQDAVARNNSPYVNLKIANADGNETISVFDVSKAGGPHVGQIVFFTNIRDYQGKKSANNLDMKLGPIAKEDHPLYRFVPRPVKKEAWDACIETLIGHCTDTLLIPFIKEQAEKLYKPYCGKPAATSVHHAFPGGLVNHTYQMLHLLEGIYPVYPYPDEIKIERCIIGILFHDWGKLAEYNTEGECQEQMYLLGHIYMSANYLNNLLREINGLDKREINFIVHCVLAHHGELEYGSPVKPCIPEAQLINYVDNISARADIFSTAGNMEKTFALGTTVVK